MLFKKNTQFRIKNHYLVLSGLILLYLVNGCKVSYSFSGASISPEVKTVAVLFFPNRATIVNPTLSQDFSDALRDKIRDQTNLVFMSSSGDVNFGGEIVEYRTSPLAITGDDKAAMNRFTIGIRVKFTNVIDPEQDFEKVFSRYQDYDSSHNLSDVEEDLVVVILKQITEDIFNQAFVNW
ncbi:MAG: LptE family protein [Bacteroidota bacterium]|nr:LptE family protein [Bacteroidota bacterium]